MADTIAQALVGYKIVMLRGHAVLPPADARRAFQWTDAFEEACEIIMYAKQINEEMIEYRRMSDSYSQW